MKKVNTNAKIIGKSYFFRTVTYHIICTVVRVAKEFGPNVLQLKDASWIADSGRFTQAISEGKLSEVEPIGEWFVNIDACTDFGPWKHSLPKEQK